MNPSEFNYRVGVVLTKWSSLDWTAWIKYFKETWLDNPKFNTWQMYQVPAGYPSTNDPIESFNKLVKLVYTNYYVTTLLKGLRDRLVFKPKSSTKKTVSRAKSSKNCLNLY